MNVELELLLLLVEKELLRQDRDDWREVARELLARLVELEARLP